MAGGDGDAGVAHGVEGCDGGEQAAGERGVGVVTAATR